MGACDFIIRNVIVFIVWFCCFLTYEIFILRKRLKLGAYKDLSPRA